MFKYLMYAVLGYFSGSILFGYWIPLKVENINIYEVSKDGNPGTSNTFAYCGFWCGVAVIVGDLLKGALPVYLASRTLSTENILFSLIIVVPILGTAFPPFWYHLKGGKAIAVSFGVTIGLLPYFWPLVFLAGIYIALSTVIVIRPHRFRSILAFFLFALANIILIRQLALQIGFTLVSAVVIFRHLCDRAETKGAVVHEGSHIKLQYRWRP